MGSLTKFSVFKHIKMPHIIKRGEKKRRVRIKENSIYLARQLLAGAGIHSGSFFHVGSVNEWEHLADAVNLAFVGLTSVAKTAPPPASCLVDF